MKVRIFAEGGGNNSALLVKCQRAFNKFFERAKFGRMPKVVACGSRFAAFDHFRTAVKQNNPREFPLLLVDSEGPVEEGSSVWVFLKQRENWDRPSGANEENVHLMVQLMESWFLADRETLARFFGQGFTAGSIPQEANVEKIAKATVESSLTSATRNTKTKGQYNKSKHSFDLLAEIDPAKVRQASPIHAERLFSILEDKLG